MKLNQGVVVMAKADDAGAAGGGGGAKGDPWAALKPQGAEDITAAVMSALGGDEAIEAAEAEEGKKGRGEEEEDADLDEEEEEEEGAEEAGEEEDGDAKAKPDEKLTALEEALAEKDAKVKELEAKADDKVVVRSVDVPLGEFADLPALEKLEASAQDILDWCQDNPEGGECPFVPGENGKPKEFDGAEAVKSLKQHVRGVVRTQIPARKAWLGAEAERLKVAQVAAPELFKDGSEVQKEAAAVLKEMPQLRLVPGSKLLAHEIALGRQLVKTFGPHAPGLVKDILASVEKAKPKRGTAEVPRREAGKPRPPEAPAKKKVARGDDWERRVAAALGT